MCSSEWGNNALDRYKQVVQGIDITFSKVFLPIWKDIFSKYNFQNVLEVGCGTGILSAEVSRYVESIMCIEKDNTMIKIAKEHNLGISNISFLETSIEQFNSNHTFEVSIAHMVIHNISDIGIAFKSISKCLSSNGDFIFSIPHPCFYHFYKSNELQNLTYLTQKEFLIDFTISQDNKPLKNRITYYHRSLEVYVKVLFKCGFSVIDLIEVFPSEDIMKFYPEKWMYPRYLVIHAKKIFEKTILQ